MMKTCTKCPEWAQWRMRKPRFNDKEEITSWDLIAVLCGTHKKEQEEIPENKTMRFDFVGAVACL